MIGTVVRVGLLRMWHGRTEILLTFVVPIVFFTIFAFIFDEQIGLGKSPRVDLAVVDADRTELSRELVAALARVETLHLYAPADHEGGLFVFHSAAPARELVLRGTLPLAVVVPAGWSRSMANRGEAAPLQLLADASDPVATQVVTALLQQTSGQIMADRAREQIRLALALSPEQLESSPVSQLGAPPDVEVLDLFAADKANPVVSMYAAGIAVMFLLFGAVGNSGTLLEEEENQTLDRLLCSELGMNQLLVGKWLLMTIVGIVQVTIMFAWAQLAFGVDLVGHLPGFTVMTVVTAGAASSFALTLATLCRNRAQLNAVAVILILCMSALGGSMVPRYVMSETMQEVGRITFNAWALDGYIKVFWRDLPIVELAPELAVLTATTIILFGVARLLAHRWESS
ncbi:MAG: ABC transporter permease [Thermoanaerobaculales bacterium]|jgi:ABC-2 type transport system permease protein|nr:ABC transporter permease [Thermoanaerobaculales bacterium]